MVFNIYQDPHKILTKKFNSGLFLTINVMDPAVYLW